ncbi:hypothetical protein TNCV_129941 [Trichonephila clavipes]|nr:hypothetical protein TNCV_129941 [Trichonephila clavipes]
MGANKRQAIPGRTSTYLIRSREKTRRQVEEVATTSRRNRSRPNKLRRGKDTATTGFTSEEERRFTIEQLDGSPSQRSASVEVLRGDSTESL